MTEEEWLTTTAPTKLLGHLNGKTGDRKLRLFAAECVALLTRLHAGDPSAEMQIAFNQYADGTLGREGLWQRLQDVAPACDQFVAFVDDLPIPAAFESLWEDAIHAALWVCRIAVPIWWDEDRQDIYDRVELYDNDYMLLAKNHILFAAREIVGNPFRSVTVDPDWRTTNVMVLATDIYEECLFDRMPILADALQDAGCDNDDILNHCRQPGEHTRGCWVADLMLGKA